MKKKIKIEVEIEYEGDRCEPFCNYNYILDFKSCKLFNESLHYDSNNNCFRCQQCLEATNE